MGWGGKRDNPGRKKELPDWERQEVAHEYIERMQLAKAAKWKKPYSKEIIRQVAEDFDDISERMVVSCINEFGRGIRAANRAHLLRKPKPQLRKS